MTERQKWTNPQTGTEHCIGQRIMWVYGRANYAEHGEIGTVTGVTLGDGGHFGLTCLMDAKQPRTPDLKDRDEPREVTFTSDTVITIAEASRRTAARFQRIADDYTADAAKYDEDGVPLGAVE